MKFLKKYLGEISSTTALFLGITIAIMSIVAPHAVFAMCILGVIAAAFSFVSFIHRKTQPAITEAVDRRCDVIDEKLDNLVSSHGRVLMSHREFTAERENISQLFKDGGDTVALVRENMSKLFKSNGDTAALAMSIATTQRDMLKAVNTHSLHMNVLLNNQKTLSRHLSKIEDRLFCNEAQPAIDDTDDAVLVEMGEDDLLCRMC